MSTRNPSIVQIEAARAVYSKFEEEHRVSRIRGRQEGYIRREGPSWLLTYRGYKKNDLGEWADRRVTEVLGDASLTLKQAKAKAKPTLDRANRVAEKPSISMLVGDFIDGYFWPNVLMTKKPSGVKHYRYLLDTFIAPRNEAKEYSGGLALMQLCDVGTMEAQQIVHRAYRKYSRQTLLHIKNAISGIFKKAMDLDLYERKNPAHAIEIGEITAVKRPTYTPEQLGIVLIRLPPQIYEMALLAAECSLGPAELCGIRIRHCNLSDDLAQIGDMVVASHAIAIQENFYEGKRDSLKGKARLRIIPLAKDTSARLQALIAKNVDQNVDAPLFQSRAGTPIDTHNVANRTFKALTKELGFSVTWYGFRRAHSSLAAITGADTQDRKLIMGHSKDKMSLYYDVVDVERMRGVTERILAKVSAVEGEARDKQLLDVTKVVEMRRAG